MKLTAEEELWLESYREILSKQFPGIVDQIIVFGSKAKGTAMEDSDLDLLLVIRDGRSRMLSQSLVTSSRWTEMLFPR
jgi:predicted nucleotidyltransferase